MRRVLRRFVNTGDLARREANFAALTPIAWIERAAKVHGSSVAVVDGERCWTWSETRNRAVRLSDALRAAGIGRNDVVQVMLDNTPEMYESHFGVPMSGACLGCINTRLDARAVAYILQHSEAKAFVYDARYDEVVADAKRILAAEYPNFAGTLRIEARVTSESDNAYEALVASGSPEATWAPPGDEWDALSLNYTSGTTGDPKGVVLHHRGAYLCALGNTLAFDGMNSRTRFLWTLPMFHCNGWNFPYSVAAIGGANVCLRQVNAESISEALETHGVTHLCGAPIVLRFATEAMNKAPPSDRRVKMMVAAAPPPPAILRAAQAAGLDVTHVYGLTEVYGPAALCEWQSEWNGLDDDAQALVRSRQGVEYATCARLDVVKPGTTTPVDRDGQTLGEIVFQGNTVMKGYFKNPAATEEAFKDGLYRTGDLAVVHADNYVDIKDRAKDIVISGGENISSIEVAAALVNHPQIHECAVVPRPDSKWGEHPCAFVELEPGATLTEADVIAYARTRLAGFKVPKTVVFEPLPRTSTGKIQKYILRERAKHLLED
ncbi:hypothetical protein CTAYLR_005995 [Chrysophaeum taylorii]|uniref:Acyl-CoA synthetase n=1 Tax=Chrysophaeum taylorii TaxID=2483200 RepID=A0AAD7U4R1_9STRA|nr:hypothetical protein CTAYLR_005995 [Chrysophaeum taylorii]